jgi:hypothetical protein
MLRPVPLSLSSHSQTIYPPIPSAGPSNKRIISFGPLWFALNQSNLLSCDIHYLSKARRLGASLAMHRVECCRRGMRITAARGNCRGTETRGASERTCNPSRYSLLRSSREKPVNNKRFAGGNNPLLPVIVTEWPVTEVKS